MRVATGTAYSSSPVQLQSSYSSMFKYKGILSTECLKLAIWIIILKISIVAVAGKVVELIREKNVKLKNRSSSCFLKANILSEEKY